MDIPLLERALFIIVILILSYVLVRFMLKNYLEKRKQKRRFARGINLENRAHKYLERLGYLVIDKQKIYYHHYEINGIKHSTKLILDYVVEKSGKKYIVEVKSGKSAISIDNRNTRRQLLEYDFTIQNDGIFLLDMENENMQLVKFNSKAETEEHNLRNFIIILAVLGILIPFWKIKILITILMLGIWKYPEKAVSILKFMKLKEGV